MLTRRGLAGTLCERQAQDHGEHVAAGKTSAGPWVRALVAALGLVAVVGTGGLTGRAAVWRVPPAGAAPANQLPSVLPNPPAVTLGPANAPSTIANGVITPITATVFQNDGHRLGRDAGTPWYTGMSTTPNLNAPTAWANAAPYALAWQYTGAAFDLHVDGNGASYRFLIDGQFATAAPQTVTATDDLPHYLHVAFSSAGSHTIVLETANYFALDGLVTSETDTLAPAASAGPRVIVLGDSFTEGQDGTGDVLPSYVEQLGLRLGWQDIWASGSGGTGYLNPGPAGSGREAFAGRLQQDVLQYRPDVVIVAGGFNDVPAYPADAIGAQASHVLQTIRTQLPHTTLIVLGPWGAGGTVPSALAAARDAIQTAAAPYADLFIDLFTGQSYRYGQPLGPATGRWITGTGNAGQPHGDGNADQYIAADGVHPTLAGHAYLGQRLADALLAANLLGGGIPTAPTNLHAGTAASSSVQVQWDAISGATSYGIAWRRASDSTYTVDTVQSPTTTDTIGGLGPGTTVYAYVQACNSAGCSPFAGYLTLQSTSGTSTPTPPPTAAATAPSRTGTLSFYPSQESYPVGDTFSATLYAFGNGQSFAAVQASISVSSNLQIVELYPGNCNLSYTTMPAAVSPSFAGTIPDGTSSCVVYSLAVRATTVGTGYLSIASASMGLAGGGSNILKATTDGSYPIK
jgi:lysophospholipase L1-like esterase